jgi:hypothetical protein
MAENVNSARPLLERPSVLYQAEQAW